MGDRLKRYREQSQQRKKLLAQAFGYDDAVSLKDALNTKDESAKYDKEGKIKENPNTKKQSTDGKSEEVESKKQKEEEEDEFYTDSSKFLKGTQSANPHNDYCQHFVDTGERPQNFIRDTGLANRFEEYPKLRELIKLKDDLISDTNTPPMYLQCDLERFDLSELHCKFDVIHIEPPLAEYQRSTGAVFDKYWDWNEIEGLNIQAIAAQRSFLWIWCGNAEGLERGRQCLKRWGFRRCEDICWIKTNPTSASRYKKALEPSAVFQRTKEHCLMGIKGTVKRSTDGDFIHANVDIDLIIEEEKEYGSKEKPVEIFHIMEHFCLGRRRLHIFGRDSTIRPGWLTIGPELTTSNFDAYSYSSFFTKDPGTTTGCSEDIERLRPKSPTPKNKQQNSVDRGGRQGNRGKGGVADTGGHSGGAVGRGSFSGGGRPPQARGSFTRGGRSRGFRGGGNPR
ncbi:hypothetical protein FSP39_008670 [Pinctada imbricata]|uniref:N(6)-adenosine-methyltransferase non-catalytic subunit METTL14 n=1 Tax=Pinctada imbricata TaxID=66713 RepID=A0AA89BLR2_PINIB|nr:hypothetical protein FSP39_008670 [Pinctada imbricata]